MSHCEILDVIYSYFLSSKKKATVSRGFVRKRLATTKHNKRSRAAYRAQKKSPAAQEKVDVRSMKTYAPFC
jgi:hypothetical protein